MGRHTPGGEAQKGRQSFALQIDEAEIRARQHAREGRAIKEIGLLDRR